METFTVGDNVVVSDPEISSWEFMATVIGSIDDSIIVRDQDNDVFQVSPSNLKHYNHD